MNAEKAITAVTPDARYYRNGGYFMCGIFVLLWPRKGESRENFNCDMGSFDETSMGD